jgi:tRNA 2-thiocytidine biosynthesis protein TtcA
MKRMLGLARKAIQDYDMIAPGDKIAVGVSGGKDSLTLLMTLAKLREFYPVPFDLVAITLDMCAEGGERSPGDFTQIRAFCEKLGRTVCRCTDEYNACRFRSEKREKPMQPLR